MFNKKKKNFKKPFIQYLDSKTEKQNCFYPTKEKTYNIKSQQCVYSMTNM